MGAILQDNCPHSGSSSLSLLPCREVGLLLPAALRTVLEAAPMTSQFQTYVP